ncbi:MAG: glycosyltransferase family 9 protein [Pseudomonadota bacterium]
MLVGVISQGKQHVLDDQLCRLQFVNFSSGVPLREDLLVLPYSSAATPGRYLAEMFRRMLEMDGAAGTIVVNPYLELTTQELGILADELLAWRVSDRSLLVEDATGTPIAYQIPKSVAYEYWKFLNLISCVDADIDAELIALLSNNQPKRRKLELECQAGCGALGFYSSTEARYVYRWLTVGAVEQLQQKPRPDWGTLRFAAILPFNAGDVLFMSLAMRHTKGICTSIVVDRRYAAIQANTAPDLDCVVLDLKPRYIDGVLDWDWALLESLKAGLPPSYLYLYCRPSRRYDRQPVHLIDQYAFGTGAFSQSSIVCDALPLMPIRAEGHYTKRLFMHFDAGWPLKVFPVQRQRELLEKLQASGFEVTVCTELELQIGKPDKLIRFTSLEELNAAISECAIVVGMDSFPVHYSIYVLGLPTICLFSSTHPSNSDACPNARYRALHQGLTCAPCGGYSRCPEFGGETCRNFVETEVVVSAVNEMWSAIYEQNGNP